MGHSLELPSERVKMMCLRWGSLVLLFGAAKEALCASHMFHFKQEPQQYQRIEIDQHDELSLGFYCVSPAYFHLQASQNRCLRLAMLIPPT